MGDLLRHPAALLVPIAAYFLGWSYLDAYFAYFGVSQEMANRPIEQYFTRGYLALVDSFWRSNLIEDPRFDYQVLLPILAVVFVGIWFVPLGRFAPTRPFLALIVLALFVTGARELVREQAKWDTFKAEAVNIVTVDRRIHEPLVDAPVPEPPDTQSKVEAMFQMANSSRKLRLVYQNNDVVVVAWRNCQPGVEASPDSCGWQTFMIPWSVVRVVNVARTVGA